MIQFEKTNDAKKYYNILKGGFGEYIKLYQQLLNLQEYYFEKYEDDIIDDTDTLKTVVIGRSGKIVWIGTEDAIEDTK